MTLPETAQKLLLQAVILLPREPRSQKRFKRCLTASFEKVRKLDDHVRRKGCHDFHNVAGVEEPLSAFQHGFGVVKREFLIISIWRHVRLPW
jgi:hypothetical protein